MNFRLIDYSSSVEKSSLTRLKDLPGPVLITGHTGFKGAWLTLLLEALNIETVGISLPAQAGSLYERSKRNGMIHESFCDIRNREELATAIKSYQPSAVIHMAAQPLVLDSYRDPVGTFETNVVGTANVLDASFKTESVQAIIGITTDKVYKNNEESIYFKEDDALEGHDPYSASKVGSEAVIAAWQQIARTGNGPKLLSVRAGNVIGGGDYADNRLLPDLIKGFTSNTQSVIRNPSSTRPWQHVLDPLFGYLLSLEYLLGGGSKDAFNFGPDGASLTVGEVAQIAQEQWGTSAGIAIIPNADSDIKEAKSLQLDSTLARTLLSWAPRWSQTESVVSTVQWWKQLELSKINPTELCLNDIDFLLKS